MNKSLKNGLKCAIAITAGIYIVNKITHAVATVKQLLTNDGGAYYKSTYGTVYYKKQGSGPAMLLLHDLSPESNSYEWNRMINDLSKHYTVYTMDLLGCGRSDRPHITYTGFLYVRLIEQFIQDVIEEETIIAATGRSASIAVLTANSNHELVSELVLVNPQSFQSQNTTPEKFANIFKNFIAFPIFGTFYYNVTQSYSSTMKKIDEDYFYNTSADYTDVIYNYYESAHLKFSSGKYLYASIVTGFTNNNIAHALRSVQKPIHIIIGEDVSNNGIILENYKKLNTSIDSCIISYTKQLPQLEAPDKTLQAMYRLLGRTDLCE